MSSEMDGRESLGMDEIEALDWDTPEDAFLVIRAWREQGPDAPETWHWRGQVSRGTAAKKFVGLAMLFDLITGMLNSVAEARRAEDPDG